MDSNSGLPPEILVLCTTTETKEKAVRLLDWIRHIPDIQRELAWEPAIPAICSLIASEQLGNTVVTERRAQQWSQSTPEHFRAIMTEVQKLLVSSRTQDSSRKGRMTLQSLVDEFCPEQNALNRVLMVEKAFGEANGRQKWQLESDIVQLSIFVWSCRQFKIRTAIPVEDLQQYHNLPMSDFKEIQDFLTEHCASISFLGTCISLPYLAVKSPSPQPKTDLPPVSPAVPSPSHGMSSSGSSVKLEDLAIEFGIGEDVMGGMRFLEKTVRERYEFKDLVNWNSTMGRCVIFYWTCSVLKIPSAKHKTLRTQYNLAKKEFDKILSALDLQRGDLRKKLEAFYAGNPALQLLPQSTQWAATSPAKPQYTPPTPVLVFEKSASPAHRNGKKGTGRRGRPPKPKSPPPISVDPVSKQEQSLSTICGGPTLRRALLLLRSFNAKRHPASEADRVPPKSLPAIVALVASQQLGDGQMSERRASQVSCLPADQFATTLAIVRTSIDIYQTADAFAPQTTFDDLALEHGLGVDTIVSMMHVREALKESRCLSIGMDWESPLVKCSVFFWTCAILKVSDVKQTLLRTRSLASKREFDSMLQLLNSHCTVIRHQLEIDSATGAFIFAPPPHPSQRAGGRQHPSFYGEQEIRLEGHDGRPAKRIKRETMTPSELGSDALESQHSHSRVPPRKPGRPPKIRKLLQLDDTSDGAGQPSDSLLDIGPVYVSTTQFPPANWKPPETLSAMADKGCISASACPSSETGESKRRHTRYSTLDYKNTSHDRIEVWKPEGDDVVEQQARYRQWEERMALHYGPHWEKDIGHEKPGIPFE